jgi:hypothetical protein
MEKWVRRSLHATLTAGVVGLCAANLASADDTTIVAPDVDSQSTSVLGDNSILGGNSLSAPVVAPVTGNDVAVAGIGGAVNAEDVLAVLGIVGNAHAGKCVGDDYTEVSPKVRSSSTSVAGDNSIGTGNTASVPVVAPITDNKVAVAGIGGAVNADKVTGVVGIVGNASCGDGGDGNEPYSTDSDDFTTDALPIGGAMGLVGNATGVADGLPVAPTSVVDDVVSLAGLGGLGGIADIGGLTNLGGLPTVADVDPSSAVGGVTDTATGAVTTHTAELASETATATETAELQSSAPVSTTHAGGSDTTVVAPKVKSSSTSVVGDNSIGSGNSLSAPVVVPVTGNDVAVAGIGGAVNADNVTGVLGLLGNATALLD